MYRRGASDLLLTVGAPPQFRVNGRLEALDCGALDPPMTRRLANEILSGDQMEELERRKSIDFSRGIEGLSRFRFNVYFQRGAVAIAVRMISFDIRRFEELGLPDVVRDFASHPHGLVLVTGPAGSGKSTTLAAMIDHINSTRHAHIICIEDPIEYLHSHKRSVVEQREVRDDTHGFSDALHSVFRQSPDVIMVGEMRDLETTQLALTLAETGHLILATLHTQDTTHAVNRIADMFPIGQREQVYSQLSLVLVGVVAQQLLPVKDGSRRVLACEIMNLNNAIRNLIREGQVQQIYSAIQTGRRDKMITMNDALRELHGQGLIDEATARRRSPRPKELASLLGV